MQEITDSDNMSSAMLASNMFQEILDLIQSSNLNFQLQVSPFAAQISLRKSLVRDKAGKVLPPGIQRHDDLKKLVNKNDKLQNELSILQSNHEVLVNDFTKACQTIETLKNQIVKEDIKPVMVNSDIEEYADENKELKAIIEQKNEDIQGLELADKMKKEMIIKLNNELKNTQLRYNQEKEKNKNDHKAEVKRWRKELGEEEKVNIKLKDQLKDIESESIELKEKIGLKDEVIAKAMDEKISLEEKIKSLLDVLYGCSECGLCEECECYSEECDSSLPAQCANTEQSPPPAPESPAQQHPPQPNSWSSPWSPPPTPPCESCGGVNIGPCPSKVGFNCISPLPKYNAETETGSPSRTPPGTPPLLRNTMQ